MKTINTAIFNIGVARELAKRNNPNYSEENYTHVIPSVRNFTVRSQRNPEPKSTIMARAAYSRGICDKLNNR